MIDMRHHLCEYVSMNTYSTRYLITWFTTISILVAGIAVALIVR